MESWKVYFSFHLNKKKNLTTESIFSPICNIVHYITWNSGILLIYIHSNICLTKAIFLNCYILPFFLSIFCPCLFWNTYNSQMITCFSSFHIKHLTIFNLRTEISLINSTFSLNVFIFLLTKPCCPLRSSFPVCLLQHAHINTRRWGVSLLAITSKQSIPFPWKQRLKQNQG